MLGLGGSLLQGGLVAAGFIDKYSIAFDGDNDHLDLEATFQSTFRDSFSISFWCRLTDGQPSSRQDFFGSSNSSGQDAISLINQTSGRITFVFKANNDLYSGDTGNGLLGDGDTGWKHVVITLTHSGSGNVTPALFLDGESETLTTAGGGVLTLTEANAVQFTTDQNIFVGGGNANGSLDKPMAGNINDFAIWEEALDGDAVTAIYNSGSPTDLTIDNGNYDNSGDLIGYWKFEEASGTTATDSVGSNDGTLNNGASHESDTP